MLALATWTKENTASPAGTHYALGGPSARPQTPGPRPRRQASCVPRGLAMRNARGSRIRSREWPQDSAGRSTPWPHQPPTRPLRTTTTTGPRWRLGGLEGPAMSSPSHASCVAGTEPAVTIHAPQASLRTTPRSCSPGPARPEPGDFMSNLTYRHLASGGSWAPW